MKTKSLQVGDQHQQAPPRGAARLDPDVIPLANLGRRSFRVGGRRAAGGQSPGSQGTATTFQPPTPRASLSLTPFFWPCHAYSAASRLAATFLSSPSTATSAIFILRLATLSSATPTVKLRRARPGAWPTLVRGRRPICAEPRLPLQLLSAIAAAPVQAPWMASCWMPRPTSTLPPILSAWES